MLAESDARCLLRRSCTTRLHAAVPRRRTPADSPSNAAGRIRCGTSRSTRPPGTRSGRSTRPLDQYNFGPLNYYQRPDTRYSLGALGHYELAEYADVYTQLMFNDYESIAQIAPGGEFFGEQTFQINCDNPMLSRAAAGDDRMHAAPIATATRPMYIGRRNVEGGGRQDTFHNTGFRGVVGIRGAISENWDYDASAQYSKGNFAGRTLNRFVLERSQRAIDVVIDPDPESATFGQPVCRSVLDGSDPNCVPYNIFDLGSPPTQDALAYLQAPTHLDGPDRPGDLHRHRHGRPRRHRAAEPVRLREHPDGVRRSSAARTAWSSCPTCCSQTQLIGGQGGPITRPERQSTRVTDLLRRAAGSAGAGRAVRGSARAGHGLPLLGLRRPDDRHLQDRDGLGADRGHPVPRQLPARGSCGERDRAVHRAGLQSVRHGGRSVRCGRRRRTATLDGSVSRTRRSGATLGGTPARWTARPASTTSCRAATPTSCRRSRTPTRTASSSSRGSCRSWRCRSTTSTSRSPTRSRRSGRATRWTPATSTTTRRVRPHPPRPANGSLWLGDGNVEDLNINIGALSTKGYDLSVTLRRGRDRPVRRVQLQPDRQRIWTS